MQGLEDEFPCASWLPVIYQNPAAVPLTWLQSPELQQNFPLYNRFPQPFPPGVAGEPSWLPVGWLQLSAGGAIAGSPAKLGVKKLRSTPRQRPSELPDARILLVGADEEDIVNTSIRYPMPFWLSSLKNWSNIDPLRSDWIFFATNLYRPVMIHSLLS
jgi:hypothetical protein